jgi:hypothetical protein
MKKVRVNITLDQSIHEKAAFFSIKEGKSLSENIELPVKEQKWNSHYSAYGIMKGQIFISEDFDEPLEMFKEYVP